MIEKQKEQNSKLELELWAHLKKIQDKEIIINKHKDEVKSLNCNLVKY